MTEPQTQANLALFIGETYCEIAASTSDYQIFYTKEFFLPQISLKSGLTMALKEISKLGYKINNIYVVCRYMERLKTFRLGGSVIQVTHSGLENNYTLENTTRFSLAAASLIIGLDPKISGDKLIDYLNSEFDRTKKINPEANKVVINLDPKLISNENINLIEKYFNEKNFKIFLNKTPTDLRSIRKILLNAGTEGTKEELTKEINDIFTDSKILFWSKNKFEEKIENFDLYFSSDDFLSSIYFSNASDNIEKIIHLDIENWMILEKHTDSTWDSPWGKLDRPHYKTTQLSIHPLTEILIDENAFLQFSKNPAPSEPGPMTAGRGVKSLVLDVFFKDLKNNNNLSEIFPALKNINTENKITSQFKVLEHGQKTESKTLKHSDINEFIIELVQFDISRLGCNSKNSICTGNMSFIYNENNTFKWSNEIIKKLGNLK